MENAVEAIEYGFGVLVFVIALSISMNALGDAKETADIIYESIDTVSLYQYAEYYDEYYEKEGVSTSDGRIVGVETIIPTIYRDFKENFIIQFYVKGAIEQETELERRDYLILELNLSEENKNKDRAIWTGNANTDVKRRLDYLVNKNKEGKINNKTYNRDTDIAFDNAGSRAASEVIEIKNNGLYAFCIGRKFIEQYAYCLSEKTHEEEKINERVDKIVIRYVVKD